MTVEQLQIKARQVRLDVLKAIYKARLGSTVSCMSVVEILIALYYGELNNQPILNFDSSKPGWDGQDYVILSKNHAVTVQYAILADLGFFDKSELEYLGQFGGLLTQRPSRKIPGITFSDNSIGHGLSMACGLAMSLKAERQNNRVFTVLGDAELQSGQVWEAAQTAAHYKLNNLFTFIDDNKMQMDGLTRSVIDPGFIAAKFESFGWRVLSIRNGHDFDEILDTLVRAFTANRRPVCLWCHTVCGKGIEFAEGKPGYHGVKLSEGEMSVILPDYE